MNLTVHIGTTKTGSTSIQAFMRANRAALAERGICYPASLGPQDHRGATVASLNANQSRDLMQHQHVDGEKELAAFRAKTRAAYLRELQSDPREVVISSEHLQSRCILPENLAHFRELFCRDFDRIRIVVYIRPQLDQIVSLYSTLLRSGYAHPLNRFVKSRIRSSFLPYFDLRALILRWSAEFGAENLIVRPYKAISGEMGTLGDFCALLDLDPASRQWRVAEKANTSINVAGQELLMMLNQTSALDDVQRRKVARWAETHCAGKGATPRPKLARAFQAQFDEGNAWVVENYFPDHPEYLEPRWPRG